MTPTAIVERLPLRVRGVGDLDREVADEAFRSDLLLYLDAAPHERVVAAVAAARLVSCA